MNLDDLSAFQRLDTQNMIAPINALPDQLEDGWKQGMSLDLPRISRPRAVLLCGMGGSAVSADLLVGYAAPICPLPLIVQRDYDLPAWASGPETLVIVTSNSGNSEEMLSVYQQAQARGCARLAITTGGKLAETAQAAGDPLWTFEFQGQPRAAAGITFGLLLAALHRLSVLPDPSADFQETLSALRSQREQLRPESPIAKNPSKRLAGQMVGRIPVIFAADAHVAAARRWKNQINENAKTCAQFEILPEADHNTLAGINNPEAGLSNIAVVFLMGSANHPRNQLRLDFTRQIFMTQGINTDVVVALGHSRLAQIWTLVQYGDYTSYYLAMAYGEDPTPVDALVMMKEALASV